ncbi:MULTISPECIES: cytochrome c [unclassified Phenylobacterium]|uniref:c-type cytochrome n=1 Tax=unclassified Phenylobacterium TaxID=2640670 RepID=UPI001F2230AA|nr:MULTISPECIES: cytochrome c [unclassified Phenylobacterium]
MTNPARARVDYMLKCQGCHQPDGAGNPANTPPLRNHVARFLSVTGGREFLVQVPGVASTDLSDDRLAEVLNWSLLQFDAANVPQSFKPYSSTEVGALRKRPLRLERMSVRETLIAAIEEMSAKQHRK